MDSDSSAGWDLEVDLATCRDSLVPVRIPIRVSRAESVALLIWHFLRLQLSMSQFGSLGHLRQCSAITGCPASNWVKKNIKKCGEEE